MSSSSSSSSSSSTIDSANPPAALNNDSCSSWVDGIPEEVAALQHQEHFYGSTKKPNAHSPFRPYMVQWMLTIHDTFQLCPLVVPTAMYYLDCMDSSNSSLDYQLCGLTALHLATKVHETRIFQLKQLLEMGNVCFTEANVLQTEQRILQACQWRLHPPVPEAMVYVLGKLFLGPSEAPVSWSLSSIPSLALQILRQRQLKAVPPAPPSVIAYASLLVAMEQSCISVEHKQAICYKILQVTGYSATTKGLSEAYKMLATPLVATTAAAGQPSYSKQQQLHPTTTSPVVLVQAPAPNTATTNTNNNNDNGVLSHLVSPESRDEGEYREVIFCAEEGIEVTFCGKPPHNNSGLVLDSISPRNVVEDL